MQLLFGQPYDETDPCWVVMACLDIAYADGRFVQAVEGIVRRYGFAGDGACCSFPDPESPFEEEHFEGVEFAYGEPVTAQNTVVVSDATCERLLALACERYLHRQPGDSAVIHGLLAGARPDA